MWDVYNERTTHVPIFWQFTLKCLFTHHCCVLFAHVCRSGLSKKCLIFYKQCTYLNNFEWMPIKNIDWLSAKCKWAFVWTQKFHWFFFKKKIGKYSIFDFWIWNVPKMALMKKCLHGKLDKIKALPTTCRILPP